METMDDTLIRMGLFAVLLAIVGFVLTRKKK
jgi:hypothetical protein